LEAALRGGGSPAFSEDSMRGGGGYSRASFLEAASRGGDSQASPRGSIKRSRQTGVLWRQQQDEETAKHTLEAASRERDNRAPLQAATRRGDSQALPRGSIKRRQQPSILWRQHQERETARHPLEAASSTLKIREVLSYPPSAGYFY
jgi:hypothetical protein